MIEDSQVNDMNVLELIDNVIAVLMPQNQPMKVSTIFPFKRDKIIKLCQ